MAGHAWPRIALVASAILGISSAANAQVLRPRGSPVTVGEEYWWSRWSPLSPLAEWRRVEALAPAPPQLLGSPVARTGAFWSAGNPATLRRDVDSTHSEARISHTALDGDYRRPLDPGERSTMHASVQGWRALDSRAAVIGGAALRLEGLDLGTHASGFAPYASSPLVPTDTTTPHLRRSEASLEGAIGWRLGPWGVGVALGYASADNRAERSSRARIGRLSSAGGSVGISRRVAGSLEVGAYARATGDAETVTLVPNPFVIQVLQLEGYFEVDPREFATPLYRRRIERDATGGGVSLAGHSLGADWVVHAEVGRLDEEQSSAQQENPPLDTWAAEAWSLGLAGSRPLQDSRGTIAAAAKYTYLEGDAERSDLIGHIFRAEESSFASTIEGRYTLSQNWTAGARFDLQRDIRLVRDALALLITEVRSWSPAGGISIARRLTPSVDAAAGYSVAAYATEALLPEPDSLGPVYQTLIAPETEMYAAPSRAHTASVSLQWRRSGWAFSTRAAFQRMTPSRVPAHPLSPTGDRRQVGLEIVASSIR